MTANQVAYQRLQEEGRANLAREAETHRSNLATEGLRRNELEETSRHNLVTEAETKRSNLARELETNRHNVTTENLGFAQLQESSRHNRAQEGIGYANVGLGYANLSETARANQASESIRTEANAVTKQYNEQRAAETRRANMASETNERAIANLREQEANRRKQAELEVQIYQNDTRNLTGVAQSIVRLLGVTYGQ